MMKHLKLNLDYIAGFVDGEGCVSLPRDPRKGPRFILTNTDKELLEDIRSFFGGPGRISEKKGLNAWGNPRGKRCYQWICWNRHAETVLRALVPYLHLKQSEARLALEWFHTVTGHGRVYLSESVVEIRQNLWKAAKEAKRQ